MGGFDKDLKRMQWFVVVLGIIQAAIGLAILAGIGFTVYKVMIYLGVF